jgi:hypothetical protein
MANPATTDDIESRWRSLTDLEQTIAETRLDDAWRKLKRDVPDLEARMVGDTDLTADVVRVLADAVIRLLRSAQTDGMKRRTVAVDDGSATYERDTDYDRASLYFTESELGDLSASTGAGRARAYSVMPC